MYADNVFVGIVWRSHLLIASSYKNEGKRGLMYNMKCFTDSSVLFYNVSKCISASTRTFTNIYQLARNIPGRK